MGGLAARLRPPSNASKSAIYQRPTKNVSKTYEKFSFKNRLYYVINILHVILRQ